MIARLWGFLQAWAVRILVLLMLLFLVFFGGLYVGDKRVRRLWDADKLAQEAALQAAQRRAAEVTTRVVTQYVDRVQVVQAKARTITKEVPIYVPPKADAACVVPVGFVRLHNAAVNQVPLPGTPSPADGAPSGVALSTVADTIVGNYGSYAAVVEQLKAWQAWAREQKAAASGTR